MLSYCPSLVKLSCHMASYLAGPVSAINLHPSFFDFFLFLLLLLLCGETMLALATQEGLEAQSAELFS